MWWVQPRLFCVSKISIYSSIFFSGTSFHWHWDNLMNYKTQININLLLTCILILGHGVPGNLIIDKVAPFLTDKLSHGVPSASMWYNSQVCDVARYADATHSAFCEHNLAQVAGCMEFLEIIKDVFVGLLTSCNSHTRWVVQCDWASPTLKVTFNRRPSLSVMDIIRNVM